MNKQKKKRLFAAILALTLVVGNFHNMNILAMDDKEAKVNETTDTSDEKQSPATQDEEDKKQSSATQDEEDNKQKEILQFEDMISESFYVNKPEDIQQTIELKDKEKKLEPSEVYVSFKNGEEENQSLVETSNYTWDVKKKTLSVSGNYLAEYFKKEMQSDENQNSITLLIKLKNEKEVVGQVKWIVNLDKRELQNVNFYGSDEISEQTLIKSQQVLNDFMIDTNEIPQNPTKENYIFAGWKILGDDTVYSNETLAQYRINQNIDIIPVWTIDSNNKIIVDAPAITIQGIDYYKDNAVFRPSVEGWKIRYGEDGAYADSVTLTDSPSPDTSWYVFDGVLEAKVDFVFEGVIDNIGPSISLKNLEDTLELNVDNNILSGNRLFTVEVFDKISEMNTEINNGGTVTCDILDSDGKKQEGAVVSSNKENTKHEMRMNVIAGKKYTLTLSVTDTVGHSSTYNYTIIGQQSEVTLINGGILKNDKPNEIVDYSKGKGEYTYRILYSINSGDTLSRSFQYQIDNGILCDAKKMSGIAGFFSNGYLSIPINGLEDGKHKIIVYTKGKIDAEPKKIGEYSFNVDSEAPVISSRLGYDTQEQSENIESLKDAYYLTDSKLSFQYSDVSNVSSISYFIYQYNKKDGKYHDISNGGVTLGINKASGDLEIDTTKIDFLKDGIYKITLNAKDDYEHEKAYNFYFAVDKSAPTINKISRSTDTKDFSYKMEYVKNTVEISLSVQDEISGIKQVYYSEIGYETNLHEVKIENGEYKIAIDTKDGTVLNEEIYIVLEDNQGNKKYVDPIEIKIDRQGPQISGSKIDNTNFTNQNVKFTSNITDNEGSGIAKVEWSTDKDGVKNYIDITETESWNRETGEVVLTIESNGEHTLRVTDMAGNVTESKVESVKNIDKKCPEINSLNIEVTDKDPSWKNTEAKIKINAQDDISGISEIAWSVVDGKGNIIEDLQGTINPEENEKYLYDKVITISGLGKLTGIYKVKVKAKDFAGNLSKDLETDLRIDNTNPEITWESPEGGQEINGEIWYSKSNVMQEDFELIAYIKDDNSGVSDKNITINASVYNGTTFSEKTITLKDKDYTVENEGIATKKVTIKKIDGLIWKDINSAVNIEIQAKDNTINGLSNEKISFHIDNSNPKINGFKVAIPEAGGYNEVDETELSNTIVRDKKYGYYFKQNAIVNVYVSDNDSKHNSSGIKSIKYFTCGVGQDYKTQEKNATTVEVDESINQDKGKHLNEYVFQIPVEAGFKGQIYVTAFDAVGNQLFVTDENGKQLRYVKPASFVIDNDMPDVKITLPEAKHAYIKDEKEHKMYGIADDKDDIKVKLKIQDKTSGIRKITWSISSPNKIDDQLEVIEIDNDGKAKIMKNGEVVDTIDFNENTQKDGWKITSKSREQNLITALEKEISITKNDNDIVIKVEAEDRAGNVWTEEEEISRDITLPKVKVEFSNNDVRNGKYFDAIRTATIFVTDKNFNPETDSVKAEISNSANPEKEYVLSKFEKVENSEDTYKAIVEFTDSGDYKFSLSCTDEAGNIIKNSQVDYEGQEAANEFCIDLKELTPEFTKTKAFKEINGKNWVNNDMSYNIKVDGNYSKIKTVKVTINGRDVIDDTYEVDEVNNRTCIEKEFSTQGIDPDENGKYEIKATITNFAGVEKTITEELYRDDTAPTITKFEMDGFGNNESNSLPSMSDTYGYFYKEFNKVTIYAKDDNASCGLESITYYVSGENIKSEEVTTDVDNDGKIEITLPRNFKGEIYAKATDKLGNETDFVRPEMVVLDDNSQENSHSITIERSKALYKDCDGIDLYSSNTDIVINVTDIQSGIRSVEWRVVSDNDSTKNQSGTINVTKGGALNDEDDTKDVKIGSRDKNLVTALSKQITVTNDDNNIRIYVQVTDRAGNETSKQDSFSIDKTAPKISVTYDDSKAENERYFKANRTATVEIAERNFDENAVKTEIKNKTKLKNYSLSKFEKVKDGVYQATIRFNENGDYDFAVNCEDLAKNSSGEVEYPDQIAPEHFYIDKTNPNGRIDKTGDYKVIDGRDWVKHNMAYKIVASDADSDIRKIEIKITGANEDVITREYKRDSKNIDKTIDFNTNKVTPDKNGKYTIVATVTDYAGNSIERRTEVYEDSENPIITRFDTSGLGYNESNNLPTVSPYYGYFYRGFNLVTIRAEDRNVSCGLESITYYFVNHGTKSQEITVAVNGNGEISIPLPVNFKGEIFAKSRDRLGKESSYVKPEMVVLDNNSTDYGVIEFERSHTSMKDIGNLDLYSQDTPVRVHIKDITSGVRRVRWSVISSNGGNSNQSGEISVSKDGVITGDAIATVNDRNLVTQLFKDIIVSNNDNNITVFVEVEDRAGNISSATDVFSIDKTAPVIVVSYDNNTPDAGNARYFNRDRNATITVTERNFNENNFNVQITNSNGTIPVLSGWTTVGGTGNGDNTVHRATLSYVADGDYTFGLTFKDNANNTSQNSFASGTVSPDRFTIDKTLPTLNVSYNNNNAANNNYYQDERVATFSIVEHNFDAGRFELAVTQNGYSYVPEIRWSGTGDIHTANIYLNNEALYTVSANYRDMAGNAITNPYTAEFYVDKAKPELTITGISDKTAYTHKVISFKIKASDTYFDGVSVDLSIINKDGTSTVLIRNNEDILGNLKFTASKIQNGKEFSVENLTEDGIYRLDCHATDKAGRTNDQNYLFSVNRQGPTYFIDDPNTLAIKDKYLKSPVGIVIDEISVNNLQPDRTKLTVYKGNSNRDLVEGTDYKIDKVEGEDTWCRYRYIIDKENFKENGIYHVAVTTKDNAGNEAISDRFSFIIDNEAPNAGIFGLKNGKVYVSDKKNVKIRVTDNIALSSVRVLLNGKEYKTYEGKDLELILSNENILSLDIESANTAQKLTVEYMDMAGNLGSIEVKDFYITKNMWIRFTTNKPLVVVVCLLILIIIGSVILIIVNRRNKNRNNTN